MPNTRPVVVNAPLEARMPPDGAWTPLDGDSLARVTLGLEHGTFRFATLAACLELARALAATCPDPDRTSTGLVELMVNALEHGNLGITYEEKSALADRHAWRTEVQRRQALPEHRAKRVTVTYERLPDRIRFEIHDEGPGFDWRAFAEPDPCRLLDRHGRGILMACREGFDRVDYRGTGNIVVAELTL